MADNQLHSALHRLCRLAGGPADEPADDELLARFVDEGDQHAFAALVRRHGPMVHGVCRRVLGDDHDADDAFQAAFLVLARKAGRIRRRESLASWLHGVALRVSRKAQTQAARRRARERAVEPATPSDPLRLVEWRDLRLVLDEELAWLGEKYRAPLVQCYLEGKSHEEAARDLGWPNGTVCGRLARGRELLRRRLERRGVALSAGGLVSLLAGAVPAALPARHLEAASALGSGSGSPAAVALAEWAVRSSAALRAKLAALATLCLLGVGASVLFSRPTPTTGQSTTPAEPPRPGVVRFRCGHPVAALALSPDGQTLATAGPEGGVRLWRADGQLARSLLPEKGAAGVAFSPDGRKVAAAGLDGVVRVWDVEVREPVLVLEEHSDTASAVAFSPDGKRLASVGWDSKVCLWELATGRLLHEPAGHRGRVWAVAFAPDGKTLATGGGDRTVRLWETETGRERGRVGRHRGGVYALAFTADGRGLAASEDNTVCLWDVESGRLVDRVAEPGDEVTWFAAAPDGRTLAYGGGRSVRLWEPGGGERLRLDEATAPVGCLAFAADGRTVAAAGPDGTALLWDLDRLLRPDASGLKLGALWTDLGGDAPRAYRAVWALTAISDTAVPFLAVRLGAGPGFGPLVARLIEELDHRRFAVREQATAELTAIGPPALPALRRALEAGPPPEVHRRLERILDEIERGGGASPLRHLRALEALERIGTPEARRALDAVASAGPEAPLAREARGALGRLK